MRLQVKICGVRTPEAIQAAADGGASYVGFVFYPKSPRALSPSLAAELSRMVPTGVRVVGLFVDPDDEEIDRIVSQVPLDMLQLHGEESPARVTAVRRTFAMPVMKAVRIASRQDVDAAADYEEAADRLLFDTKPPPGVASLPGGTGLSFDWGLLAGRTWRMPWMLAGGLTAANLAEAVSATGAGAVDVSSGVENRPGQKEPGDDRGSPGGRGRDSGAALTSQR